MARAVTRGLPFPCEVMDTTPEELVERLGSIPAYVDLFVREFGQGPAVESFAISLAAYLRTLSSDETPFDLFARGDGSAISQSALRGWRVFCAL